MLLLLSPLAAGASEPGAPPSEAPPAEDGAAAANAQPPAAFGAEGVLLLERKDGRTQRSTRAQAAELTGDDIAARDVTMQVHQAGTATPRWRLQTPWARLALAADRATFGPVHLFGDAGEHWQAEGGTWEGEHNRLVLYGRACAQHGGQLICAERATLFLAPRTGELEEVCLVGDVSGRICQDDAPSR